MFGSWFTTLISVPSFRSEDIHILKRPLLFPNEPVLRYFKMIVPTSWFWSVSMLWCRLVLSSSNTSTNYLPSYVSTIPVYLNYETADRRIVELDAVTRILRRCHVFFVTCCSGSLLELHYLFEIYSFNVIEISVIYKVVGRPRFNPRSSHIKDSKNGA